MLNQTDARVAAAVEAVAACVEFRYFDAGGGARAADALRTRLRTGGYSAVAYAPALAPVLTADLQAALRDLHLQTRWSEEVREASTVSDWDDPEYLAQYWAREALSNFGFDKAERLGGNVGLLVVASIDEPEGTAAVIDAAFAFLARCSALIVDLRRTTGGAPTGVAHFLGHLLPAGTPLIEVIDRAGAVVQRTATSSQHSPSVDGEVPVFALIGPRTVSGCEELVYDLRAADRATLVGATTAGAANPVDLYVVDPHVVVRVPTATVRHAITGTNWEAVGIVPDVECVVQDALPVAHRLAVGAVRLRTESGALPLAEGLLEELTDVEHELDELLGRH
jgi:hypothetical protein